MAASPPTKAIDLAYISSHNKQPPLSSLHSNRPRIKGDPTTGMPGALGLRDGDGVQLGESCRDGMGQIGEGWCVYVGVGGGGGGWRN